MVSDVSIGRGTRSADAIPGQESAAGGASVCGGPGAAAAFLPAIVSAGVRG